MGDQKPYKIKRDGFARAWVVGIPEPYLLGFIWKTSHGSQPRWAGLVRGDSELVGGPTRAEAAALVYQAWRDNHG